MASGHPFPIKVRCLLEKGVYYYKYDKRRTVDIKSPAPQFQNSHGEDYVCNSTSFFNH